MTIEELLADKNTTEAVQHKLNGLIGNLSHGINLQLSTVNSHCLVVAATSPLHSIMQEVLTQHLVLRAKELADINDKLAAINTLLHSNG